MTERRFTDKPELDPSAVFSLGVDHAAMMENRTLFPTTVVTVDEAYDGRLLVSGENSRRLGKTIAKGKFKDYNLYSLTLEERATCSAACEMRGACYGNGMQLARRHKIGDLGFFAVMLEDEVRELLLPPSKGLMIRLHVLGDFPNVEYVAMWADLLMDHENLACFGYTHWSEYDEVGKSIAQLKGRFPDRFRIRWSSTTPSKDAAVVINRIPSTARVMEGIVCPAQTNATACCASCGLCWEGREPIAFIKHGRASMEAAAEEARVAATLAVLPASLAALVASQSAPAPVDDGTRQIAPLKLPSKPSPALILTEPPEMRMVAPTDLRVEAAYQRDLSSKSVALIRKIVANWDWAKFKPPVCAETPAGLFVIDGQHTAIAAASHPKILRIPVMIAAASAIEDRAGAFVAHNRDRLAMSPFQLLHAEAAAGGKAALEILAIAKRAGAFVPRAPSQRGRAKPGEVVAASSLRDILAGSGCDVLERILRIAVMASCAPISTTIVRALRMILTEPYFGEYARFGDARLADALHSMSKDLDDSAGKMAVDTGVSRYRAAAMIITIAADSFVEKAA